MSLLCDAHTAFGTPCKNRSAGEVGGRHFCRIASHKAQIEALPLRADGEEEESGGVFVPAPPEMVAKAEANLLDIDTTPDAAEAEEEVVAEAEEEVVAEAEEEVVVAYPADCLPCEACGEQAAQLTAVVGGLVKQFRCLSCGHARFK